MHNPIINFFFVIDTLINCIIFFLCINVLIDILLCMDTGYQNSYIMNEYRNKSKEIMYKFISFFYLEWGNNTYVLYGDHIKPEKSLIISNHISSCDHGIIINLLSKSGFKGNCSIVAASKIEKIPIFNLFLYYINTIFVRKGKDNDIISIRKNINKIKEKQNNDTHGIILFPEGTYLDTSKESDYILSKSNSLFEINDFEKLNYVLFPRKTGMFFIMDEFFKKNEEKVIYDITILQYGNIYSIKHPRQITNFSMFSCLSKNKFHILVKRRTLSNNENITDNILLKWWKEKDINIDYFVKNKEFDIRPICILGNKSWVNKKLIIFLCICINSLHYFILEYMISSFYINMFIFCKVCLYYRFYKSLSSNI